LSVEARARFPRGTSWLSSDVVAAARFLVDETPVTFFRERAAEAAAGKRRCLFTYLWVA